MGIRGTGSVGIFSRHTRFWCSFTRFFFVTTTGLTPNVVRWVFCGVTEGNNCKLSSLVLLKFVWTCSNVKILVPDDPDTVCSRFVVLGLM